MTREEVEAKIASYWLRLIQGNVFCRVKFIERAWDAQIEIAPGADWDRHVLSVAESWSMTCLPLLKAAGNWLPLHAEPIPVPDTEGLQVYAGVWAVVPNDQRMRSQNGIGTYIGGGRWDATRRGVMVVGAMGRIEYGPLGDPTSMDEGTELRRAMARVRLQQRKENKHGSTDRSLDRPDRCRCGGVA